MSGAGPHVPELAAFDAWTNTEAQTTVSKCFDAISQRSVKQKSFVGFYTARKTVSTQKDTDINRQERGLFAGSLDPRCVCRTPRPNPPNPAPAYTGVGEGGSPWPQKLRLVKDAIMH